MSKKVSVIGAGFYGSTTAMRLAEYNVFDTVVLTDIVEGKPEGLALDMNQSRSIEIGDCWCHLTKILLCVLRWVSVVTTSILGYFGIG